MRLGNDSDHLDELARSLLAAADDVAVAPDALRRDVLAATWHGADRDRLVADLQPTVRLARAAGSRLADLGRWARTQAAEQRRISAANGEPAPTTALLADDDGDGRRVSVVGDLTAATHVVIVVPGMGSTAANFDDLLATARLLQARSTDASDGELQAAVVAWLGYDAPAGIEDPWHLGQVLDDDLARVGARQLRRFLDGLRLDDEVVVTLVGHSYGSLVVAGAARSNPAVDQVVVLGSPGVGADRASELRLAPGTRLFAAAEPGDLVARSGWFGTPPTDPRFGASVLDTRPWPGELGPGISSAHSAYFDPERRVLGELVDVVNGRR